MNKREVAALAIALAGSLALMHSLPTLSNALGVVSMFAAVAEDTALANGDPLNLWRGVVIVLSSLLPFVALVAMGGSLIAYRERLAARLFPPGADEGDVPVAIEAGHVQACAFAVAGVILVAWALPDLTAIGYNLLQLSRDRLEDLPNAVEISAGTWAKIIGFSVQILLGILLFFGARGLARVWYGLRRAGLNKPS